MAPAEHHKSDESGAGEAPSTATLGDILFRDRAPAFAESDWVALVRAMAEGDKRALRKLHHRTEQLVFTVIMRIVRNAQTAEEVTLDVFHDAWRRAPAYDPANGPVIGWLLNLSRSRAIDRTRFDRRQKRVDPRAPEDRGETSTSVGPDGALEFEEQGRRLRAALTTLSTHEREAIETAFFGGLTHSEAAERLGQPLGTLKTRIRSGLDKLRRELGGERER